MAKSLSETQADQYRNELGMKADPVPVQEVSPRAGKTYVSNQQFNYMQRQQKADRPSLWEITKSSAQVDNNLGTMFRDVPEFPIDLEFDGKDYWKQNKSRTDAMPGVDLEEVMADVVAASSLEEAEHWLKKHEEDYEHETLLQQGGLKALLPRMAISIFDPVDIAVGTATGGLGAALVKAGKWGKIATAAVSAGAATGTTEALLAANNANRDETDVMFAVAAGVGLGGGIGALLAKREAKQLMKLKTAILDDAATPDSAGAARRASESLSPDEGLSKKAYDDVQEMLEGEADVEFGLGWLTKPFRTLHSKWLFSSSQQVRKIGSKLTEGGYLKNKSQTRSTTAEGAANVVRRKFEAGVFRDTLPAFKAWAKENKVGSMRRAMGTDAGEEFYSQVGRALRGEASDEISGHAKTAATAIRKHLDEIYERARRAGVKGFERGALDDYFPRLVNRSKFDEMRRTYGREAMSDWYARAIESANDDIDYDLAQKIGKAYVRTMIQKVAGVETDLLGGIRLDDIDELEVLMKGDDGVLHSDVEELISELRARKAKENADRGGVTFGKRRIHFDENFTAPIRRTEANGGTDDILKFHQMYENDARRVLKRYGQIMSGHIGVAEELGIKSRREWEVMEDAIVHEGDQLGRHHEATEEVKALRTAYDLLVGKNTVDANPAGDMSQFLRTATGYTYTTRGGQFGVNALAEMGNIIGAAGVRAFLRSIPEWKSMMTRAANGQLEHGLARNLELLFAPGINTLTGVSIRRLDEFGEQIGGKSTVGKVAGALDKPLTVGGRVTSLASGLNTITDVTGRVAAVEMLRKLARFAGGKKISAGQAARLRGMGITPAMQERIFESIREAGVYRKGRLVDLKPEKWTDDEALDAMSMALNRETRSIIQENDLATVTKYFHHPIGKAIFQFMRFPMEAVQKQLGRGLHYHDAETLKSWVASMFIGSTVYMAQQSIEYANNPEELKKRLTPENVGKVGFMRTGFSSMLPAMIDLPMAFTPAGKQFELGRSSGLTTGSYLANPLSATVDAGFRLGTNVAKSALSDEQQIASQDIRDASKLVPGYRMLGMSNVINWIAEAFPESRKQ